MWIVQYKEKEKCRNTPKKQLANTSAKSADIPKKIEAGRRRTYKLQYKHKLNRQFSLESHIQTITYHFSKNFAFYGYGIGQKCTYKYNKIAISVQLVWFDADANTRLYMYEKGPLYSESRPSMYDKKGIKPGIAICYKPTAHWRLEGKYSCMWILNNDHIGSANDMIMSNVQQIIRLQLIYAF